MDENADGGVVTSVATENATSVTVDDDRFEVDGGNLKLTAGTMLDFETDSTPIEVTITASGDGASDTHTVSVSINDVNEDFTLEAADGAVDENADGAAVGAVTVTDPDAGDTHTYEVSDDRFEVAGGMLKLKDGMSLDYETEDSVTVTVTATDSGGLSQSVDVMVTVNGVNEAPSVSVADGTTPDGMAAASTIDENAAGVPVGEIMPSDPDDVDTYTFEVSDDRFEAKQDDVGGWWVKLKDGMDLDHETEGSVTVTVTITDAAGLSATTDVTVTVSNVDEAPSAPMVRDAALSVDENDTGTILSSLADSTDPEGDAISYSVDDDRFEVTSGLVLKLKDGMSLDHEAAASVDLVITASDPAGNSSDTTVTVDVGNVNEAPSISVADGTTPDGMAAASTIDENAAGVPVGEIMPSDPDDGDTYTFEVSDDRFEAKQDDVGGWWVKLKDGMSLDHETEGSVPVTVTITDAAGLSATTDVTVTVSDVNEAPSVSVADGTTPDDVAAASTIDENAAGVPVGEIMPSDPDDGDTYTFEVSDDRFEAKQDDVGGWWVKLKDGMDLDHETEGSVTVTVTITDAAGLSATTDVTVTVSNVDEAPSAPMVRDAALSVNENDTGTILSSLADSTDPEGDAISYSVGDERFEISSGVLKLKEGMSLDHEATASVDLVITASDPAGNSTDTTVTVAVSDVNEAPEISVAAGSLAENEAGADAAAVTVTDVDAGDTRTYEVSDDRFEVANDMLKLKDGMSLDHEYAGSVTMTVTVTDAGGLSASADATVTVTNVNEAPELTVGAPSPVGENTAGADVASVSVADVDAGDTHGYVVSGADGVIDDRFEVANDMLKLKDGMSLDFETDPTVALTVTVTDAAGLSDSADVTVTVGTVNEAPELTVGAPSPVVEDTAGAAVASVSVADADAGDTHDYVVSGADGMIDDRFEVANDMLKLKDGMSLDFETDPTVALTVTVTDAGGLSASADVAVTVSNVNEAAEVNGEVADAVFEGGQMNEMEIDLKALFSDPDGDGLNYRLSESAPEWLKLEVTFAGTGEDQTITGRLYGTAPESDITADGVSIIATDGRGLEAHAMFDVVVDEENDAPTRLELRVTDDEGVTERLTAVNVEENAMGAELGNLVLDDPDDARHPHGQHEYTFMVDGEADERFEVKVNHYGHLMLKLKDDESLDLEGDGGTVELTVTATDMMVGELAEGEDATTESISLEITITVGDVDVGDTEGPAVVADAEVKDVTITVDEDLDEDDVDEGDWLETVPAGLSTAFEDADGDDLTYSLGTGAPRWLQIDEETGQLTNAELMLPRRGVYDVTIVASDDDGNSAEIEIKIAVAISDAGNEDNDEPDIRNTDEIGFDEGDESGPVVATFEVRDDDIEIDPHPFGVLTVTSFTAMQDPGDGSGPVDVTNAFKVVRVGDDGNDTANYEIRAKTPAELAMGYLDDDVKAADVKYDDNGNVDLSMHEDDLALDKDGNVIPVEAIDYEEGDEIDFDVEVEDGAGDGDGRSLSIDIEDAPDESPVFQGFAEGTADKDDEDTTVISVDQNAARTVIILQLEEIWEDPDTDDDDLDFEVGGTSGLDDDWIQVYGPDQWEDIHENRRNNFEEDDGEDVEGLRDRDEVVVIVIDRSEVPSSLDGASFTISADDGDGNSATETIMISVANVDVDPADADKVVSILGGDPNKDKEVTGTGNLTMTFNAAMDPDFAGGEEPFLVLYTWIVPTADDNDPATEDVMTVSVSTTPQPLPLGVPGATPGMMNRNEVYLGGTITAKVEVFERDPGDDDKIVVHTYMTEVEVAAASDEAPVTTPPATSVTFGDLLTDDDGISVSISATGEAAEAGTARLEASNDGSSGWITVDSAAANTGTADAPTTVTVMLDVNADGDTDAGDGGGLYYRVVYVYDDEDDDEVDDSYSDVIQLGDVTEPAAITLITPTPIASGGTVRVNNLTADVAVQWQLGTDTDDNTTVDTWTDIDGETGLTLSLTDDHAGKSVRAKLTHMGEDDATTTDVDESEWVTAVDHSAVAAVAALPTATNNPPVRTQADMEIRVNLNDDDDEGTGTGNVAGLFFDADGDDLTYSLAGDLDTGTGGIQPGRMVYRSEDDDQILTIDGDTGEVTYYTSNGEQHGANTTDGGGNIFSVTVQARDDAMPALTTTDNLTVNVRVNVAPTSMTLGGTDLQADATMTIPDISAGARTENDPTTAPVSLGVLDVMDLNDDEDMFGTHTITFSDDRFEAVENNDDNGSTWTIQIKQGADFDYEADDVEMGVLKVKVTATDGGGKKVEGYFSITITNDADDDATSNGGGGGSGGVMTAGAGAGNDDNGPGNAPGDGGLWVDQHYVDLDLLDEFVISIDDIDVA